MNSFAVRRSAVCALHTRINNVCIVSEGHTAEGSTAKEFIPSRPVEFQMRDRMHLFFLDLRGFRRFFFRFLHFGAVAEFVLTEFGDSFARFQAA